MPFPFRARSDDGNRSWQAPSYLARPEERLSFSKSMQEMGEQWVQAQSAYKDIPKAIDTISGTDLGDYDTGAVSNTNRSNINTARLKRNSREVIGTLANIRPFWGYSSQAQFYQPSATMTNQVARAVYLESFFDRSLKGALQYSLLTGDGYIWPKATRGMYGRGPVKIKFDYLGALDVLPVQMPRDNDLQEAYIVTLSDFVPVAKAHSMFPMFQDQLKPMAKRRYRGTNTTGYRMTLAEKFKFGSRRDAFMELYCDIQYQYILDQSINTTGADLHMGQENTSWSYIVPYVGKPIELRDPISGATFRRLAIPEDCYVYPYRRLMIYSEHCLLYDGPAWDWHAMVPAYRISLDRWVHEGTGQILLKDGWQYQKAINELERGGQTVANARLRPSMTYDIGTGAQVNSQTAEALDPFAPDKRVGVDSSGGSDRPPFAPILPEWLMEVPGWMFQLLQRHDEGMDYQLGLKDVQALMKARANASSSDMDKFSDASTGPIVQDISRDMEMPIQQVGEAVKYLILQYMTTRRIMQFVGEDGITPETFDYDPESLVPSHLPSEINLFRDGQGSGVSKLERARHFANNLRFSITPYSLHEITQMAKKLGLIQLKKAGIWISSQTIAEAWNVPNYGSVGGNTEMEKYWNEKIMEMEQMARLKQIMEGLGLGQPGGKGGGAGPGRPSSFNQPPEVKNKDGGTRSTITTSK
jgi:hypothetical protein